MSAHADLLEMVEELHRRKRYNVIAGVFPDEGPLARRHYPKHVEFMDLGAVRRIRAFIAANRVGKSTTGTVEMTYHLTGNYPPWWKGKRFNRPVRAWAASDTQSTTRDALQRKLVGDIGDPGSGWIPKANILGRPTSKPMPAGAIDFIQVRHVSGGVSSLAFKSYDMGRAKFQADDIDVILLDEEPRDYGIYSECVTRTATTGGIVMLTFTALRGITPLICRFMPEFASAGLNIEDEEESSRAVVVCGWDDVPHLDEKTKAELKSEYGPHEIQARTQGIPSIGIGQIYPVPEDDFKVSPFPIPPHWPRVAALDPGWNRTAAVWGAIDPESDTIYLYSEHYRQHAEVEVHAAALKARGVSIPFVSDDATDLEGNTVIGKYAKHGLLLRKAQKSDKDARITEVYSRLSAGKMKVFSTLHNWFFEFRMYRRDESGRIQKKDDHLMNCTEYLAQSGVKVARVPAPPRQHGGTTPEQTFGIYQ